MLYVVATPIGNPDDISARAIRVLKSVDLIAAEDTRRSGQLLAQLGVATPMLAYHDHSDAARVEQLISALASGKQIALISDAGTPLVSDPGYRLVRRCHESGIRVTALPGACAAIAALSIAGLPSDRFCFEGFLPPKAHARANTLASLKKETRTLMFYESPRRIAAMLADVAQVLGQEREVVIVRELTKTHETLLRGTVTEVLSQVQSDHEQQLGEIVVLVAGYVADEDVETERARSLMSTLMKHLPVKAAVSCAEELSDLPRNKLYKIGLELKAE